LNLIDLSGVKMERQEEDQELGSGEEPTSIGGACYPPAEAEYQQLVENGDLFLDKLRNFHSSLGTNFRFFFSCPAVGSWLF